MGHVSRLAKLRAMPAREVASRGLYAGFTLWERQRHRRGAFQRPNRLRPGLDRNLARRKDWRDALLQRESGGRFFAGIADAVATADCFRAEYREELTKARKIADRVAGGEIDFFGESFSYPHRIDWHADPPTKRPWPRIYHRDVPIGSRTFGDPKYVWELNRHQFLVDLAKIALVDGSARHHDALVAMVLDWQREVPYGTGPAWACALEPAFRAWSWMWAYHLLRARGLEPDVHEAWLTGFYDHGRFLYRHLETYVSPYNHLIGEASALFALGLLFPEFLEAERWAVRGREILESTLPEQFHEDGGTVEQSTFYHHATLGFYLLSAMLGRCNGVEFSSDVWHAIQRGIEFSIALMQPDGRIPPIGGADDGKPIRLEHLPLWDFRPYHAIAAVLFQRGDFKAAAGRFWEDALWILGPEGRRSFDAIEPQAPETTRTFPATGYSVVRTDWSVDADYLCFDCGPQAAGLRHDDVPSAAHGHADCLSVIATLAGHRVLTDPGFYCYNGEPDWEVHFRKTAAHNTIAIDGLDQARHVSKMAWTRTYVPRLEGHSAGDAIGWVTGSHDGFQRQGRDVVHRRTAWLRPDGYLVVCDEITSREEHLARANYQFGPGSLVLDKSGDAALFAGRFALSWSCSVPVTATLVQGGDGPDGGWIAPSLGVRVRAPRVSLEFPVRPGRVVLLTILSDRARCVGGVSFAAPQSVSDHPVLGARIDGDTWHDVLVAGTDGRHHGMLGIETDASLVVRRVDGRGDEKEAARIGGTFLRTRTPAATPAPAGEHGSMAAARS